MSGKVCEDDDVYLLIGCAPSNAKLLNPGAVGNTYSRKFDGK